MVNFLKCQEVRKNDNTNNWQRVQTNLFNMNEAALQLHYWKRKVKRDIARKMGGRAEPACSRRPLKMHDSTRPFCTDVYCTKTPILQHRPKWVEEGQLPSKRRNSTLLWCVKAWAIQWPLLQGDRWHLSAGKPRASLESMRQVKEHKFLHKSGCFDYIFV